ncbi:MAG: SAM-dependent methyltransferase [Betaproteobacteria bacterium]|nr:SAM-dependent methyltransferase [Betaproteobacteria bacterium]
MKRGQASRLVAALAGIWFATQGSAQDEGAGRAPFVTTPTNVAERMLALAGTGPADLVVDLGSGDGRIVIAAALEHGARGLELEIDPGLVEVSRRNAQAAGVADRTEFRVADMLASRFSEASVVTAYLLPWLLDRLSNAFLYHLRPGTRIVTHAFTMTGWQPDRSETVVVHAPDPKAGAETTIHLWTVPTQVRGDWRAASAAGEWRLRMRQNFQLVDVEGSTGDGARVAAAGRLDGTRIAFTGRLLVAGGDTRMAFQGHVAGDAIEGKVELESASGRRTLPLAFGRASAS